MPRKNPIKYRRDIDGLRAIAVLSVIIYHLEESFLPGGFIGVDIFFVISGFLISNQIFTSVENGDFSILEFYRRRVKHIVPAMLLVVVVTLLMSQSLLRPQDAEKAAESAPSSLLSMANVYFWLFQDTSYFAAASEELPLLHLWSLGVEEQFYLIWPLVIIFAGTFFLNGKFLTGMIVVAIASFICGEYFYKWSPSFMYYMLPARAGELLLGCILAHPRIKLLWSKLPRKANEILAICGLLLVTVSLLTLSESNPFPGIRAIPPTIGAALLIASAMFTETTIARGLSTKPMVLIGLVSYSAYLWHWPLIAFVNYGYGSVSPALALVIMFATFVFAGLTYKFIETPLRHAEGPPLAIITKQFLIPVGFLSILCLACMKLDGYGLRSHIGGYKHALEQVRTTTKPAYKYNYVCQREVLSAQDLDNDACVIGTRESAEVPVLVWGDSNAAHYLGILGAIANFHKFSMRNLEVGACPPLLENLATYAEVKRLADCRASTTISIQALKNHSTIIIGASWTKYAAKSDTFMDDFTSLVGKLTSQNKRVIILGKVPTIPSHDRFCREKRLSFPFLTCDVQDVPPSQEVVSANKLLQKFASHTANVWYFDITELLCPDGKCSAFDPNGQLRYFDASHLTLDASWALGEYLVSSKQVPAFFELIKEPSRHAILD